MAGSSQANPWRGYVVLSLVWLTVTGGVWFLARRPAAEPVQILPAAPAPSSAPAAPGQSAHTPSPTLTPLPTASPAPLRVDVAGAVNSPGVYALPAGSIVADAIAAAGGAAPGAALDRLNKAAALADGVQVYVPRATETSIPVPLAPPVSAGAPLPAVGTARSAAEGPPPGKASPAQPLDLNRATAEQLETLPGIGPELAKKIIAGRPYQSVEDLLRVSGIGEARLNAIREAVFVR